MGFEADLSVPPTLLGEGVLGCRIDSHATHRMKYLQGTGAAGGAERPAEARRVPAGHDGVPWTGPPFIADWIGSMGRAEPLLNCPKAIDAIRGKGSGARLAPEPFSGALRSGPPCGSRCAE